MTKLKEYSLRSVSNCKDKTSKREKERNSVETVLIDPFPTVKTEKERESEKFCGMTSFD